MACRLLINLVRVTRALLAEIRNCPQLSEPQNEDRYTQSVKNEIFGEIAETLHGQFPREILGAITGIYVINF